MGTTALWFQSFTGRRIVIDEPDPEVIDVIDIAHALSMTCRYGGHCKNFYSVAEHSELVTDIGKRDAPGSHTDPVGQLFLLLHDAAEAYLGDVITPVKRAIRREITETSADGVRIANRPRIIAPYDDLEKRWSRAIQVRFGLPMPSKAILDLIDRSDELALCHEILQLFSDLRPEWWAKERREKPRFETVIGLRCWSPAQAEMSFLRRFHLLMEMAGPSSFDGGRS